MAKRAKSSEMPKAIAIFVTKDFAFSLFAGKVCPVKAFLWFGLDLSFYNRSIMLGLPVSRGHFLENAPSTAASNAAIPVTTRIASADSGMAMSILTPGTFNVGTMNNSYINQ